MAVIDETLLGAVPSPADPRDHQLAVDLAAPLPSVYRAPLLAPPLNQTRPPKGEPLGTCVAHAATGMRQQEERTSGDWPNGWPPFDPFRLYHQAQAVDGIAGPHEGTTCRAALSVLLHHGAELDGKPAKGYPVASYAAVPMTPDALKRAVFEHGPLLIASAWYRSWFRPVAGVLPAPSGGIVGGHATLLFGWDDIAGHLLIRNSWGAGWGSNGNFRAPISTFIPAMHDAWRSLDRKGD
jgi:hypothetical protein